MASFSHEGFVRLFYNRPALAAELLRDVCSIAIPAYDRARIQSGDLTDIEPAHRYADLVVLLEDSRPVLGIVVEVQLAVDDDKPFTWPAYLANLRARLRCEVELLVVTPSPQVARWAAQPISIGRGTIRPVVLGPDAVPRVTRDDEARADPELAVLSALAHARRPAVEAIPVVLAALAGAASFADERTLLYSDIILAALGDAARAALEELMRDQPYEYQSEFARKHQAQGKIEGKLEGKLEGKIEGKIEALLAVLDARQLSPTTEQHARIAASADLGELERWLRKAATIAAVDELFETAP